MAPRAALSALIARARSASLLALCALRIAANRFINQRQWRGE